MIKRKDLKSRKDSERGASLVEYALLVALIAVVCLGAVTFLGRNSNDTIQKGGDGINNAGQEGPVEETTTTEAPVTSVGCQDIHPDGHATAPNYGYDCYSPSYGAYNVPGGAYG